MLGDFQALETEARRVALQLMGQAVARKLNADHSDEEGQHLPCACGAEAHLAGRRPKTFTTALGPLTLERAWYHCDTRFDRFPDCFVIPGSSSTEQTGELPWGLHETKRETTPPRLGVAQEQATLAVVRPAKCEHLALAASGEQQQAHRGHLERVFLLMRGEPRREAANLRIGQESFPPFAPVTA